MLNKIILMGRLTRDPEIRYTQSDNPVAVANFSIAVGRDFKKEGQKDTDFFDITTWRKKAEFAEKYFRKGQLICVEGRMEQYEWTDKEGNKRYGYKVEADNVYFAEGKKQDSEQNGDSSDSDDVPSGFDPFASGSFEVSDEGDQPY